MDKKIKISILLLLLGFMTNFDCLSQKGNRPESQWEFQSDSMKFIFDNTKQIISWGDERGGWATSTESETICVRDNNIFIIMVSVTSGVYCPFIYVFKQMSNNQWRLVAGTHAKEVQGGRITIRVDDDNEVILFETESGVIRKLSYDILK